MSTLMLAYEARAAARSANGDRPSAWLENRLAYLREHGLTWQVVAYAEPHLPSCWSAVSKFGNIAQIERAGIDDTAGFHWRVSPDKGGHVRYWSDAEKECLIAIADMNGVRDYR